MQFIIMDLEWNNAYCKKLKGYINEIIEFGACKVDKDFNVIDEFSVIVKAQVGKKLQGRVKALTHITNEDISNGVPFFKALSMFKNWVGDDENVFFSWGDGDIRTLIKNYEFFLKKNRIPFVNNYCDAQKYCQSFIPSASSSQQIGLSAAAFELGVNPDEFPHHRALDDSLLTAACLKRVNDSERLKRFITPCNRVFYEKLAYKPHIIRDIDNPIVDRSVFNCVCDVCGGTNFYRRVDDNRTTVQNRLVNYRALTYPTIPFFEKKGLLRCVDGTGTIEAVSKKIDSVLGIA